MSYLSAIDFITGITGGTADLEISGVGVIQVRALEYMDLQRITSTAAGDDVLAGLLVAGAGIANPKLTEDQLAKLQSARPGVIATIAKRVMALSGMGKDAENLVGAGS